MLQNPDHDGQTRGDAGHQEHVPCDHIVLLSIHGHYRRGKGRLPFILQQGKKNLINDTLAADWPLFLCIIFPR